MEFLLKIDGTLNPNFSLLFVLLDVAIILVAARIMGFVSLRIGQPRVVGEILAGVILGPSLLGPEILHWTGSFGFLDCDDALHLSNPAAIPEANAANESISACLFPPQSRPVLGILGQVALAFFMFLVGLELDFNALKGKERGILTVALGVVIVPIAMGFLVGELLYDEKFVGGFGTDAQPTKVAFSLMMGAMISVTAFPVMARILQEKNLHTSAMGVTGVAAAAIVTVLMFVLVSFAAGVAEDRSAGKHVLMVGLVALFVAIMFLAVRPALKPLEKYYEEKGFTAELLAIIVILIFACAYIAQQLEVSVIVGGFLAGAVLPARIGLFKDMSLRLSDLTGTILLPIFLAFSGLATDFTKLKPEFWGGVAIFLVAGIVAKWGAGLIFGKLGGLSWAEANVVGILMNCRGLLILVVALIALRDVGVITAEMQVGGVLMALVTTMMTGPLFDKFLPAAIRSTEPPAAQPGPAPSA